MKVDLTWTITAIIAVASFMSPVIVTLLNNRHDYKLRKLEVDSKIKQEVLSKFALTVTKNFKDNFVHDDFQESLNLLYVYFDIDDKLIDNIIVKKHNNLNDFQKDVNILMRNLSKQIKTK